MKDEKQDEAPKLRGLKRLKANKGRLFFVLISIAAGLVAGNWW